MTTSAAEAFPSSSGGGAPTSWCRVEWLMSAIWRPIRFGADWRGRSEAAVCVNVMAVSIWPLTAGRPRLILTVAGEEDVGHRAWMTSRPGIASALHCRSVVIAGKPAAIASAMQVLSPKPLPWAFVA